MTDVSTTCAEAIFRVKILKMASAQVVETSVTNNSPSQDSNHPDDLFQSRYVTPGFKPFSYLRRLSYLPKGKFYLSQNTRLGLFRALLLKGKKKATLPPDLARIFLKHKDELLIKL